MFAQLGDLVRIVSVRAHGAGVKLSSVIHCDAVGALARIHAYFCDCFTAGSLNTACHLVLAARQLSLQRICLGRSGTSTRLMFGLVAAGSFLELNQLRVGLQPRELPRSLS